MEPRIRYVQTKDSVNIAYTLRGRGPRRESRVVDQGFATGSVIGMITGVLVSTA